VSPRNRIRNKKFIVYEGDEQRWRSEFIIKRNESAAVFYKQFTEIVNNLSSTRWKNVKEEVENNKIISEWVVTDINKTRWNCIVHTAPGKEPGEIHVLFDIKRNL
jgi:hypothetical protein